MIDLELDVIASHGDDDPTRFIAIADHFLQRDDKHAAAAALDRAYGLAPETPGLAAHRAGILDELAVREHGITWRFIPAGTFLMGDLRGDPDERPVHPRRVDAFWIADVPIDIATYATLGGAKRGRNRIQNQYECNEKTPLVAAMPKDADELAAKLSTAQIRFSLPTEAQWEKAARGGLVGKRFAWGDESPTRERADFDRMGDYTLRESRALPPNGYGVFGMCGGVSEWTVDSYDALAYHRALDGDTAPVDNKQRVLRGGSWTDCADAITVSFRASRATERGESPTIGFRFVRDQRVM